MMKRGYTPRVFLLRGTMWVAIVLLFAPVSALAYLDPTTGSMVISAIVGLFASLVLAIKTYWYRIKSFFKGKSAQSDSDDGTA